MLEIRLGVFQGVLVRSPPSVRRRCSTVLMALTLVAAVAGPPGAASAEHELGTQRAPGSSQDPREIDGTDEFITRLHCEECQQLVLACLIFHPAGSSSPMLFAIR